MRLLGWLKFITEHRVILIVSKGSKDITFNKMLQQDMLSGLCTHLIVEDWLVSPGQNPPHPVVETITLLQLPFRRPGQAGVDSRRGPGVTKRNVAQI